MQLELDDVMTLLGFNPSIGDPPIYSRHAYADVWVKANLDEDEEFFDDLTRDEIRRRFEVWYSRLRH
jgi:hypothetical protein